MKSQGSSLQQKLELEPRAAGQTAMDGKCAFGDPAFAVNKDNPVHRWVPWIAGFSHVFVREAVKRFTKEGALVLDPFSGVGTTLVEAGLTGRNACGFEINPYAALACKVKASAFFLQPEQIDLLLSRAREFYIEAVSSDYQPKSEPPLSFKSRVEFFSPKVLRKVLIIQDFVACEREPLLRDLFRIAFASTMVAFSNYSYEPSLSTRAASGKSPIDDYPVGELVLDKLRQMLFDVRWVGHQLNGTRPEISVYLASFLRKGRDLGRESVDLIVTSPPYLNNYHYNRNTRPHLHWLGLASKPEEFRELEDANFGKYWQTVRDAPEIPLEFDGPTDEIQACLDQIREKYPEKGIYGGGGWANYAASYFNDCHKFAENLRYVLKRGRRALVVLGNSILQGVQMPTDVFFAQIAESTGLELIDIHIPRQTRVGSSIVSSTVRVGVPAKRARLYESVVELRKR